MPKSKDKIIIDTNLWISFLLTKDFSRLDNIFANDTITLLFSNELLEEFLEVARRPKFEKYFSLPTLQILLNQIHLRAAFITVTSEVAICRDPKDNFLLALAKDGEAKCLITGDKDLLDLKLFESTKILTFAKFLEDNKY